jgi:hypothetical protein
MLMYTDYLTGRRDWEAHFPQSIALVGFMDPGIASLSVARWTLFGPCTHFLRFAAVPVSY